LRLLPGAQCEPRIDLRLELIAIRRHLVTPVLGFFLDLLLVLLPVPALAEAHLIRSTHSSPVSGVVPASVVSREEFLLGAKVSFRNELLEGSRLGEGGVFSVEQVLVNLEVSIKGSRLHGGGVSVEQVLVKAEVSRIGSPLGEVGLVLKLIKGEVVTHVSLHSGSSFLRTHLGDFGFFIIGEGVDSDFGDFGFFCIAEGVGFFGLFIIAEGVDFDFGYFCIAEGVSDSDSSDFGFCIAEPLGDGAVEQVLDNLNFLILCVI